MAVMKLEIITAEKQLFSGEAEQVIAPGREGELGILAHHAPLLTSLKAGELRVINDNVSEYFVIAGGFMEVLANQVTVLADAAERVDEIDEERAQAAITRAQERIAAQKDTVDLERALSSLRRAEIRVQVAKRRKSRTNQRPLSEA